MAAGKDAAAAAAHFWLEKTAFFKVPRNLQDEAMEQHCRPFEDVSTPKFPPISASAKKCSPRSCNISWQRYHVKFRKHSIRGLPETRSAVIEV